MIFRIKWQMYYYGTVGAELVQRGTEREKEFSWDKCAREHFEVYKEVCEKGK